MLYLPTLLAPITDLCPFMHRLKRIIIPGLHGSDKDHWQSHFERVFPQNTIRIKQVDWDRPDCITWTDKIEETLKFEQHRNLILIGHSIGCMAIAHWYRRFGHAVHGALLVAPSDPEKKGFPEYISGFAPVPQCRFPFPTIVVGSSNDHVTTRARTQVFAASWGSRLFMLENAGHIESVSGYGFWPQGLKWMKSLEASSV